jgi:hypothetical protein
MYRTIYYIFVVYKFISQDEEVWCTPKLLDRLKCEFEMKTTKKQGIGARSLVHNTLKVGGVLELRNGTRRKDKHLITNIDLHKPNKKLVNA